MQKVFRRTILAQKQHARRAVKRKAKNDRDWMKSQNEQNVAFDRENSARLKNERRNRREDWELGPLKPKRDVGDDKEVFGTMDYQALEGVDIYKPDVLKRLEPFGGKHLNIRKGDRVVILEGHDKGKIGILSNIDERKAKVTVEGLNRVDVSIPKFLVEKENLDQRPIRTIDAPLDINAVRVVAKIDDGNGGEKDVIVKKFSQVNLRRAGGGMEWDRMIPGLDIKVPWPAKEDKPPKLKEDTPSDTHRIDVDVKTFIPTLLRPPIPRSVIDELRNKFSVFRTRHEPEYIAKKEAEEQEKLEKKKTIKAMRTPLMDAKRKERKLKKMKGKGKLTPEMLERLGKAIAEKKGLHLKQLAEGAEQSTPDVLTA